MGVSVCVYYEMLEILSLSLIRARDYSCPRLGKRYHFCIPRYRIDLEWGFTLVVWTAGVDIVLYEK